MGAPKNIYFDVFAINFNCRSTIRYINYIIYVFLNQKHTARNVFFLMWIVPLQCQYKKLFRKKRNLSERRISSHKTNLKSHTYYTNPFHSLRFFFFALSKATDQLECFWWWGAKQKRKKKCWMNARLWVQAHGVIKRVPKSLSALWKSWARIMRMQKFNAFFFPAAISLFLSLFPSLWLLCWDFSFVAQWNWKPKPGRIENTL